MKQSPVFIINTLYGLSLGEEDSVIILKTFVLTMGVIGARDVLSCSINPASIRYRSDFLNKRYFVVYMY